MRISEFFAKPAGFRRLNPSYKFADTTQLSPRVFKKRGGHEAALVAAIC